VKVRTALLLGASLVLVASLCLQPVTESDLFFRLKVGQQILADHHLMVRNMFSFTAPDHPDLDLAWLFEVAAALAFRAGGFPAVVWLKTGLVVLALAVAFVACRRRGASPLVAALVVAGAAWIMRDRFVERPHVVSFVGEAVVLAALADLRRAWPGRRVAAFAAVMVLWANAHAGIFTGVLLLGSAAVGWGIAGDRRAARRALALSGVAALASLATPVGPGVIRYLALHVALPRIHTIDEFRSATWRSDAPFFVGIALGAAIVAASLLVARSRVEEGGAAPGSGARALAPELLPVAAMAALGLASVRFAADAALAAAPLVAARATDLGRLWRQRRGGPRGIPATPGSSAAPAIAGALLIGLALGPRIADARAGRPFLDVDLDRSIVPWDAIRFVDENGLRERMYNDFETGSYLAFEGYPRARVFVDPRLPAYPEDLHRLLGDFDLDRDSWDRAMQRYGVQSALLAYAGVNRRVAWWDPDRWALVYRAGDARVFVRRLPRWSAFIRAHEIPATFRFTVETGAETLPLDPRPAASPVAECEWRRRLGDLFFDLDRGKLARARAAYEQALAVQGCLAAADEASLAAWLGADALATKSYDRALSYLDRALTPALKEGTPQTLANRALTYEALGQAGEAARDWTTLLSSSSRTLVQLAKTRLRLLGAMPQQESEEARIP